MAEVDTSLSGDKPDTVQLIYILYLAALLVGITSIVGVVMAYMNRSSAPEWLQTHYTFVIHTFWKALLYGIIGMVLSVVLIGFLVLLFVLIWWIVRCVKGMQLLSRKEPIPDPTGWLF